MNGQLVGYAVLLIIIGASYIATSSIGIQCMNNNEAYKEENGGNSGFLISQLVMAILVTIAGFVAVYFGVTDKGGAGMPMPPQY